MIVIVMGPSGAGKSTVGRALAAALGCDFVEGDALHPPANVDKMRRGQPLDDADRGPWLMRLEAEIRARLDAGRDAVVACSALKERYRRRLMVDSRRRPGSEEPALDGRVRLVNLQASPELLAARLQARAGHFMPPSLLPSQLAALEPPANAIDVDAALPPEAIVADVRRRLGR